MSEKDNTIISCQMGDIFMCTASFNKLRDQKLSVKASLQVNRIAKSLQAEMDILNNAKDELIEKYKSDEKADEPDHVKINNPVEFQKEWEELMSTGVILYVRRLRLSELEGVEMTPQEIELISFLIEDTDETGK